MKKLLLLSIFTLCFASCAAQQVEQLPLFRVNGTVTEIIGDRAIVSAGRYFNLNVGVELPVEEGQPKEFLQRGEDRTFWVEIVDYSNKYTQTAIVVKSVKTCAQIQKEGQRAAEILSNRTIIKK